MLSRLLATTLFPLTALCSPFQPGVLSPRELPASVGTVTQFRYSGNGCTQGSNSVTRSGGWVSQTYKFSQFEADTITAGTPTTENCELHFQGAGLSPGWQVSLAEADVTGKLVLAPDAKVNYYWQVYWSDDAADTLALQGTIDNTGGKNKITNNNYTVKANVTDSLWSQCIGADGNPGILNVNFRVAIVGDGSSFDVDTETLNYKFRKC
ncbi:hypothetical protein INS49_007781 [Diaporthe citri]|uniref:uncharacterized protein n=1 Tax=Diaporthe citri TaxID=83186 RepID=UPI001C80F623|nr:uncharacterized protein INS49_007781 [Diaporthe citri]KAG6362688.1 hypothetical protein INS49_007781 [Diaporthe citri]